ncbi:geranylgeranyl transferase type I beta subunit [Trichodelitschia bisporula]|uniref:Geranylgeranyl transferase type I beta subunit n=1 Tax=Trichodelitschia bisporula TaxID=703511 RepID=A0A6G1IAK8_9PEZI|nr:geranylgeranyl transferase type I beta subunit [Trichodelitschia bisporula]
MKLQSSNCTMSFDKPKHINYWKRCLKTYLPNAYTSNDSNRMTLAFFTISALDLLSTLDDPATLSDEERASAVAWIYRCQHPNGGFRGFPGTDFGELSNAENAVWDPANVPATYFALMALALLRDDLMSVRKTECLAWLRRMQRPDGSFGETLSLDGAVEGGTDSRFGYCAMGIRWMLRGAVEGPAWGVPDIDVEGLVRVIRNCQTYDGGISELPFHEAHGGFTYCALSVLQFAQRLPSDTAGQKAGDLSDIELTTRWLLSRQVPAVDEEGDDSDSDASNNHSGTAQNPHSAAFDHFYPIPTADVPRPLCIGFNGRTNKLTDTCYTWWIAASLKMLKRLHLLSAEPACAYLLEQTQHRIGGFGKHAGEPPDLYHSYMGLAALALLGHEGIKPIHPSACFSLDGVQWLEGLEWRTKLCAKS